MKVFPCLTTKEITYNENGTYNLTPDADSVGFASLSVIVNAAGVVEIASAAELESFAANEDNIGKVCLFTGTDSSGTYINGCYYLIVNEAIS